MTLSPRSNGLKVNITQAVIGLQVAQQRLNESTEINDISDWMASVSMILTDVHIF